MKQIILILLATMLTPAQNEVGATVKDDLCKNYKARKIIFYASWCSSCVNHLKHSEPKSDLFVNVFDSRKIGETALKTILKDRYDQKRVLFDSENAIAGKYKVTTLPAHYDCKTRKLIEH